MSNLRFLMGITTGALFLVGIYTLAVREQVMTAIFWRFYPWQVPCCSMDLERLKSERQAR
jgi:hypothetical protein